MSQNECSQCGDDPTIWLDGGDPRCEDCPPQECKRCGDSLNLEDADVWEWNTKCEPCQELHEMGVWCDSCDSQLVVSGWDYSGVEISCECLSTHVAHDSFSMNAPVPWKVIGRHGERPMRKGVR